VEDSAAETAETQADGRFRPGESGNPAGRPRGAKNKATILAEEAMAEKVGAVVDKLVERALAGSTSAIRQFLDRNLPMPRGCIGFDLPDLRGPRGIADAQEALIMAVATRQVPPRDAECVMNLIDRFQSTLQTEKNMARYAEIDAERERQAAAKVAPAPAAPAQEPATADPDLAAYARMDWSQLIDAMWEAEEAERKAASVPAETPPAEALAADAGDAAPDGTGDPDGLRKTTAAAADAKHEVNREIQAGDDGRAAPSSDRERSERPAAPVGATSAGLPVDHSVPQPYVDMTVEAPSERLIAARAHYRDLVRARAREFA